MPVFRLYYKLLNAQKKMIMLYLAIFFVIFFMMTQTAKNEEGDHEFQASTVSVSILDQDQSELSKNFENYIAKEMKLVDVGVEKEEVEDALFFQEITYAITIPKGFEAHFFDETPLPLETKSKADNRANVDVEQTINAYLSKLRTYQSVDPSLSIQNLHESVSETLAQQVEMEMVKSKEVGNRAALLGTSFNYLSYIFMAIFLMAPGLVFVRIYDTEIKKRNCVAPISNLSFHLQLWLACISSALILWAFFLVYSQLVIGGMWSLNGLVYMINSLLFLMVCISLTFLVSTVLSGVKNSKEALDGFTNIFALGSCFLCGVFIPQMYLSENIALVGSFLPTYWYVKVNDLMITTNTFTPEIWGMIAKCFVILLLFALVFFVLSIFISRSKASSKQL